MLVARASPNITTQRRPPAWIFSHDYLCAESTRLTESAYKSRAERQDESRWVNRVVTNNVYPVCAFLLLFVISVFTRALARPDWPIVPRVANGRNVAVRGFTRLTFNVDALQSNSLDPREPHRKRPSDSNETKKMHIFWLKFEIHICGGSRVAIVVTGLSTRSKWQRRGSRMHTNIVVNYRRPVTENRQHADSQEFRCCEWRPPASPEILWKLIFAGSSIFASGGGKVEPRLYSE